MSAFSNLKFKIHNLPKDTDLREKFPDLKKFKAIAKSKYPNFDILLRYLIYLYDPNSDLIRTIPDLSSRKQQAALYAGYSHETPELEHIMRFKDERILLIVHCLWTQVYHNRDYTEWCTLQQELEEYTLIRMKALDDDEKELDFMKAMEIKGKLRTQTKIIHEQLDALENKIFGDNVDVKNIAVVSRFTSPESWIRVEEPA
jgi:hypothetical protein